MFRTTLLSVSLLFGSAAFAANIVTDGTFEAGGGAWSFNNAVSLVTTLCANSSQFCAGFAASPFGVVSQYLNTVPGATYTITFWLFGLGSVLGGADNSFHFQWNNDIPLATSMINVPGTFVTTFSIDMVAPTSQTWLSFQGFNNTGAFRLDDITVEGPLADVPEPSTWLLSLVGASALLLRRKR